MPRWSKSYRASKIATLSVALLALGIALSASAGVFSLVLIAWSALGAALGPILLIRLANRPLPTGLALAMMAAGIGTVIAWGASPYTDSIFKVLPGMVVPLVMYAIAMPLLGDGDRPEVDEGAEQAA